MPYQTREFYETQGKLLLEGKLTFDPSNNEIRSMVLKMFDNLNEGTILDIGIGPNPLTDIELSTRGYSIIGMDISYPFIMAARKILNQDGLRIPLAVSEATDLPFSEGVFDLCLCSEVIEHLEEPAILLKEINRVLKRGGKLILTTPNRMRLCQAIMRVKQIMLFQPQDKENSPFPNCHVKEYTYYEILKLCAIFFKIQEYHHIGSFPTQGMSFLKAPIGYISNFIVSFPGLNKLSTKKFIYNQFKLRK